MHAVAVVGPTLSPSQFDNTCRVFSEKVKATMALKVVQKYNHTRQGANTDQH
jgi:hypothetical protein